MPKLSFEFKISRVDDKQIVDTAAKSFDEMSWKLSHATFTFPFGGGSLACQADELAAHPELNEILSGRLELITDFRYKFAGGGLVSVIRDGQNAEGDKVSVSSGLHTTVADFAKVVALVKRHFDALPPARFLDSLTGGDADGQFKAREAALARLEAAAAHLLTEGEQARKRWEAEYRQKERQLLGELRERTERLEAEYREREEALKSRQEEFDERGRQLKAQNRRHRLLEDLKAKLARPHKTLRLGRGFRWLRGTIFLFMAALILLFGGAAGYYLLQTFTATDTRTLVLAAVNQGVFTGLFVAAWVSFIRWHGQWLRRRAAEEFRLKRFELEIDRASWLIEMAFEWREKFQTEIPANLSAILTGSFPGDVSDQADLRLDVAEVVSHKPSGPATETPPLDGRSSSPAPSDVLPLAKQKPK